MMRRRLVAVITLLALIMVIPAVVDAAAVGRFTMVEGQVDLLKQGKLPAVPAKVQDGVEPGDVIRTKSKAKAQVKFVDDSIITMAPESRMAVADFVYDPARGYRRAVLRYFRGLVHTVVTQLIKVQEPEFIIETHTAVTGVRGTECFHMLFPNRTILVLPHGIMEGRSKNLRFPAVFLAHTGESWVIPLDQPAYRGPDITPATLERLKRMLDTGIRDSDLVQIVPRLGEGAEGFPDVLTIPDREKTQPSIPPTLQQPVLTPPVQRGESGFSLPK